MARFLAVDWDESECRYLFASLHKGSLTVLSAGSAPMEPSETDDAAASTAGAAPSGDIPVLISTLRHVLKEERIEPCPAILSLGRNKLETTYLTLPPCRESEIPVLLRNQLLRDLSGFSEFDPVDYLALDDSAGGEQKILAMTIPLSFRQHLVRSFRSLGRTPRQIGFRAVYAAELILRGDTAPGPGEPALIVNAVGSDVDLVLTEGDRIVSIRSVRFPVQLRFAEVVARIHEEIERTVTVEAEETADKPIRKVYLFGDGEEWTPLVELLEHRQREAVVVNPFTLPGVRSTAIPEFPGRFAPLFGAVLDRIPSRKARIDLLHPKEAPKATNYVRTALLIFGLLLIACFGLYRWNQGVVRSQEAELARLEKEYAEIAAQYQQVQPIWQVLRQTRNWDGQGVVWLDELRELSVVLPGEQDLVASRIAFVPMENDPRYTGMIQLGGMVRDPTVLLTLQRNLQAKGVYQMRYPAPVANPAGGGYPWLFQTSILRLRR